jgi:hypothetical protein
MTKRGFKEKLRRTVSGPRIFLWLHPVIWITFPILLCTLMGGLITCVASDLTVQEWSTVIAGLIWTSVFSSSVWGVVYNLMAAANLRVRCTNDFSEIAELTDDEYTELQQWLASGVSEQAVLKAVETKT